jgi:hypothetical protein
MLAPKYSYNSFVASSYLLLTIININVYFLNLILICLESHDDVIGLVSNKRPFFQVSAFILTTTTTYNMSIKVMFNPNSQLTEEFTVFISDLAKVGGSKYQSHILTRDL